MGYLYKEIIEYKHKKFLRLILLILAFLLLSDTSGIIVMAYKGYAFKLLSIGFIIFLSAAGSSYFIWAKTNSRYKYSIIDNELIIEKLNGSKRKSLLNINLKSIERLEKIDGKLKNNKKLDEWKRFFFMDKQNVGYLCIYRVDGKISGFCFEPSQKLLDKIYTIIGQKVVA